MLRLLTVVAALLLSACDYKSPVFLSVPLNRFESPERVQGVVNVGLGASGQNVLVLTNDQAVSAPDPSQAIIASCPEEGGDDDFFDFFSGAEQTCATTPFFMRGDLSLGTPLQIGLRGYGDGLVMGQAKLYLAGPPDGEAQRGDTSLALTASYGDQDSGFSGGNNTSTLLKRHTKDAALIAGYRFDTYTLLYGGPFYSDTGYRGSHSRDEQRQTGGGGIGGGGTMTETVRVTDDFSGDLRVRGLNLGLRFTPYGYGRGSLMVECARGNFDQGEEQRSYRTRCGMSLELPFGGVDRESAAAERQRVTVLPYGN